MGCSATTLRARQPPPEAEAGPKCPPGLQRPQPDPGHAVRGPPAPTPSPTCKRRRTAVESDVMKGRLRAMAEGQVPIASVSDSDASSDSDTSRRPSFAVPATDVGLISGWLTSSPLFDGMAGDDLERAAQTFCRSEAVAGEVLIRQGDPIDQGSRLYIVVEGEVEVSMDGGSSALALTRTTGWVFGEVAMLFRSRRTATVTAATHCVLYWLKQSRLANVLRKSPGAKRLLFLRKVPLLKGLPDNRLVEAAACMQERSFQAGEFLVRQPCTDGDLFVVRHGRVLVNVAGAPVVAVGRGHVLGPRTLVVGRLRSGDCIADGQVEVLAVPGRDFAAIQNPLIACMQDYDAISEVLHASSELLDLGQDQLENVVEEFEREELHRGQFVVRRGDVIRRLYVLREGELEASMPLPVAGGFTYFGGFSREQAAFEVRIKSATAVLLTCSESVVNCLPEVQLARRSSILFADLQPRRVVGVGNSGHVQLVVHRETGAPYALKAVYKASVTTLKISQHLVNERLLLERISPHPLCVGFVAAYQDASKLFLLQEWMPGGELFRHVQTRRRLAEPEAAFYAANVLLALTHIHALGIVHRDVKPENLLLDSRGYCKLADFGFAKRVGSEKTYTICGTPDYQAPEIIERSGTASPADMWSVGILLYELLVGEPPFSSQSSDPWDTYARILECRYSLPKHLTPAARHLISSLLRRSPAERLSVLQAREHPWFARVDFGGILAGTVQPPIRPSLNCELDTDNYDTYGDKLPQPPPGRMACDPDSWRYWRPVSS